MSRRDWYAMLHMGAKRLDMDEGTRRTWMEKHTGQRSAKDCTDAELSNLCDLLRVAGALDDGRPLGRADAGGKGNGPVGPREKQHRRPGWARVRGTMRCGQGRSARRVRDAACTTLAAGNG